MSDEAKAPWNRVIEVHPDGTQRILPPLTPAEVEERRRTFLEEYDPVTMERRSLQTWREADERRQRDRERMATEDGVPHVPYPCSDCAHFQGAKRAAPTEAGSEPGLIVVCHAFPGGIPEIVRSGHHLHRVPLPGDGGTRYKLVPVRPGELLRRRLRPHSAAPLID